MEQSKKIYRFLNWYPFTLAGTVVFFILILMAGIGLARENTIFLFMSILGILMIGIDLLVLVIARQKSSNLTTEWKIDPLPTSSGKNYYLYLDYKGIKLPPLYRFSLILLGKLKVSDDFSLLYNDRQSGWDGRLIFPFSTLYSGLLEASGKGFIGDIFGLLRLGLKKEIPLNFSVIPAVLDHTSEAAKSKSEGMASEKQKNDTDVERYYMREYVAGDRPRDINWKASSRIKKLITRIPPDTSKTTELYTLIISVDMKSYGPYTLLIPLLKSVVSGFIVQMMNERPGRQFRVIAGNSEYMIEKQEDILYFRQWLAGNSCFMTETKDLPSSIIIFGIATRGFNQWLSGYSGQQQTNILVSPVWKDTADVVWSVSDQYDRRFLPFPSNFKLPSKKTFVSPSSLPFVQGVIRADFGGFLNKRINPS